MLYRSHTAGSYLDRAPGRPFRKQNGLSKMAGQLTHA